MNGFQYTLCPKDELGIQEVKTDLKPCPLCAAKDDHFHTRKVSMTAWTRTGTYVARVTCLNCGLRIERCTGSPTGSLDESIRRVHSAWNMRNGEVDDDSNS